MHEANAQFIDLLVKSGWHQARAARELGVTTASVSRYVSGKMIPSIPVLRLFADRLQVPLSIYGGSDAPQRMNDGPRWLTDWEEELLSALRRLPSDIRPVASRAILALVDACLKAGPTPRIKSPITPSERIAADLAASLIATPDARGPSARPESAAPGPSGEPVASGASPPDVRPAKRRRQSRDT